MWTMSPSTYLRVLLILLATKQSSTSDEIVLDASVGAPVVLHCQYSPSLTTNSSTLLWFRTNTAGHENVAIGETPFAPGYSVNHSPSEGKYDLKIEKAEYDRDNGKFSCQMKQGGSGTKLHSSAVRLVVLLPPETPSIHPANPTFTEGEEANLTCSSRGGSPPPQIDWYSKDGSLKLNSIYVRGSNRDEMTTAMLSIVTRKDDDGSNYRCRVWNRAMKKNDILEAVTSINVNYFPRVAIRPENTVRVERGDTAELLCKVDAKPAVNTVSWIREGQVVAQTLKHVIPGVSSMDAGLYSCQADNHLGQVGSAEAQLDVQHGPRVHLPARKEVGEGEEVVAFCNVTANPRASSIVWSKEGDEHFVQSGPTLRLPGTNAATVTMGRYTCTAANVVHPTGREKRTRKANASIDVLVKHAPDKAVINPENPIGVEGEEVRLECGADPPGYPEPTYTWWKEGRKSVVLSSAKEMIVRSSSLKDRGKYFCQPINKFGEGTVSETMLEIYLKPKIVLSLENKVAKTGDTGLSLTCAGLAKPKPQLTWFKDGEKIDTSTSNLYQVSESQHQMDNKTLQVISTLKFLGPDRESLDQLALNDKGHYRCQFKNQVGVINTTMILRIEHSPIVKHNLNKIAAEEGKSVSVKCRVQAYPNPQFIWTKKDSNISYIANKRHLGNDTYESILRIKHVDKSSYGQYICKTGNKVGNLMTVIELEAEEDPLKKHWMIALLVLAALLTTAFLCCVVLTCCRRNSRHKNFTKKPISDPIILPSHSYDFVDSRNVGTVVKVQESPVMTKSQIVYGQPPLQSESDQFSFDSYTNSSTLPKQMQMYPYDGYTQGRQSFGKPQAPLKFNYGYDDYPSRYPPAEEYANGQQRSRLVNGDRYALPNKPRQRQGVNFNFYGDDTGVPDHYSVENISEGLGSNQEVSSHAGESIHSNAGMSIHSNAGISIHSNAGMSFQSNAGISMTSNRGISLHNGSSFLDGVPLPEGYSTVHSTPSRKVFREIIV